MAAIFLFSLAVCGSPLPDPAAMDLGSVGFSFGSEPPRYNFEAAIYTV